MADKPRIYLDSCCFIDIAKQAAGNLPDARDRDVWHTSKVLEAHKEGDVLAYTSVLTIAECTHADADISVAVQRVFTRLLTSGQYLALVQPTPFIAIDARDLRWRHGIILRGADYLHVASALSVKCTELLTTDAKIQSQANHIGALGIHVCEPAATVLLPDEYRQGDMLNGQ